MWKLLEQYFIGNSNESIKHQVEEEEILEKSENMINVYDNRNNTKYEYDDTNSVFDFDAVANDYDDGDDYEDDGENLRVVSNLPNQIAGHKCHTIKKHITIEF